jgi:hypothetical protein
MKIIFIKKGLNKRNSLQTAKNSLEAKKSLSSKKSKTDSLHKNSKSTMKLISKSKATTIAASAKGKIKNKKKDKQKKIKLIQEQKNYEEQIKVSDPVIEPKEQELKQQAIQNDTLLENQQQIDLEKNNDTQQLQSEEASLDEVIFVGYEQFDECVISSKIQQAVVQTWTPPVGIDVGTSCEMKIKVSSQGTADTVEIIKGSGILVYDTSARTALSQVEFPQEVYGKVIRIVLGN